MILEPHEPSFNVATKEGETLHRRRGKKKFEMAQEKGDDCLTKQHHHVQLHRGSMMCFKH